MLTVGELKKIVNEELANVPENVPVRILVIDDDDVMITPIEDWAYGKMNYDENESEEVVYFASDPIPTA